MHSARFPDDLKCVSDWLERTRKTAFLNGAEDKRWMEWWCLHEAYVRYQRLLGVEQTFVASHTDFEDGQADFQIVENGKSYALEITEATVPEDRRAIRAARNFDGARLLGEPFIVDGKEIPGGRFRGGTTGDIWEQAYVADVVDAIERKSQKTYARGAGLIVYPNSNATFADSGRSFKLLSDCLPSHPFSRIDILWIDSALVVVDGKVSKLYGRGE